MVTSRPSFFQTSTSKLKRQDVAVQFSKLSDANLYTYIYLCMCR